MKTDRRYLALLALFAFVIACAAMSASRRMMGDLASVWALCCHNLGMVSDELASWLAALSRIGALALLMFGFGVLLRRLWKTCRFVSGLHSAAVAVPPMRLVQLLTSLGLSEHVVVLATEVPLAFCFGLVRPRICISTGLADALTDPELRAALLHEDHHRRHYDPLRGLLAEVLAAVLFFLPVAAEWRDLFLTTAELDADRHAVRLGGRPSLAGALHKILTHPLTTRLAVPGVMGLSATEARIAELVGDCPITLRLSAHSLSTSSLIVMLGCVLAL